MTTKIEISHKTIIFTVLFLLGIWLVLQVKDILLLLFISFVLMSALRPLIERLARYRVPRVVAILLIYFLLLSVCVFALASLIPPLVIQTTRLSQDLPLYLSRVLPYWNINVQAISQQIAPLGENVLRFTVGIFSNIITILTILVFTFYFLLERNHTELFLIHTIGEDAAAKVMSIVHTVERRLGLWVLGQLFLMTVIGVFSYIGLTLLHVESALPLAIISGILEAVPMIGPIISAVPAIFVGLSISPLLALSIAALYFIIQQLENNLIVPFVMKKSVGLSPLLTIVALMTGGRLGGVGGAILAVPALLVIEVIFSAVVLRSSDADERKS